MLALAFDASAEVLADPKRAAELIKALGRAVPAMRRHRSRARHLPDELAGEPLGHASLEAVRRGEGRLQLGTLGGGNHFIEFQRDEADRLWLMIHSGSRAIGQAIRDHYIAAGRRAACFVVLDSATQPGQSYLHDMQWARRYADANRRAMADEVAKLMKSMFDIDADDASMITCDHNHVACEAHFGQQLWVHRKGAMPADADLPGVVPGSMGTQSYHVIGRGCEAAMRSSAHGAGRAMSRDAARRRFNVKDFARQMQGVWFDPRVADRLRDESPRAYKDIGAILRAQGELVRVMRTLRPVLVYKGV
jgi:tRNA-splicing ligase RtcB